MKISQKDLNTPEAQAIREAAKTLEGKGENELLNALKDATAQERAEGRLDDARMEEMMQSISPMLSDAQR